LLAAATLCGYYLREGGAAAAAVTRVLQQLPAEAAADNWRIFFVLRKVCSKSLMLLLFFCGGEAAADTWRILYFAKYVANP
jgi:hypothetical protein